MKKNEYTKKRGQFTSSTLFWYRQTPIYLKRVMPTPFSVNSYFSS